MQGGQTKQGELFIALTHEDHKPNQDYDSEEEKTSETQETDDDESETSNAC